MPEANHWGYDGDSWLDALEQARSLLQARAHRNTPTIAYRVKSVHSEAEGWL